MKKLSSETLKINLLKNLLLAIFILLSSCNTENQKVENKETKIPENKEIETPETKNYKDKKNIYEQYELQNYVDESGLSEGANKLITIDIYIENYEKSKALEIAEYYTNYYRGEEKNITLQLKFWNKKIDKDKLISDRSKIGNADWYKKSNKGFYLYNYTNGFTTNNIKD